jgi:pantoate--beta-alanine ligase
MTAPVVTTTISQTRMAVRAARSQGKTIGLVPTMGALHEGHAELLRAARAECDYVAASIFVNPAQFGPNEDFHRYPRPFERDLEMCARERVDLIFHPSPSEMYPAGFQTYVEVTELQKPLCGATRPGHFRGVATVVLKLFNIVQPDIAYFGQKDAQQARLLSHMVRDLDIPLALRIRPIVRESDGLALSSRNQYLSAEDRRRAVVLSQALEAIRQCVLAGERRAAPLIERARRMIEATPGARIDYVEIVSWETLERVEELRGPSLAALAVYFGTTRLIDNALLDAEGDTRKS